MATLEESWSSRACFSVSCRLSCAHKHEVAGEEKFNGEEKKGMAQVLESRSQLSRAVRIQRLAHILDLEQLLLLAELAPEHLHILLVLRHGEERAAFNRTLGQLSGRGSTNVAPPVLAGRSRQQVGEERKRARSDGTTTKASMHHTGLHLVATAALQPPPRMVSLSIRSLSHAPWRPSTLSSAVGRQQFPLCMMEQDQDREPERPQRAAGERGVALALSYTTISVLWYLCGMALVLVGIRPAAAAASSGGSSRGVIVRRMAGAWAATFAASQVTTPWRAGAAVALSPLIDRLIAGAKARLGLRGVLLPAAIFGLALVAIFGAGLASLALFVFGSSSFGV
jgi:hypothetical protein